MISVAIMWLFSLDLCAQDNPYLQCEDTCEHVHGIDLSHYQGEVFWETVGENTKIRAMNVTLTWPIGMA